MTSTPVADPCDGCGAPGAGWVCRFCGFARALPVDAKDQSAAVDALHAELQRVDTEDKRARLLENGPIPTDRDVLIHAGVRCVPLLDAMRYANRDTQAAARRFQAILAKLDLLGEGDAHSSHARKELGEELTRYELVARREQQLGNRIVFVVIAGAFGLLAVLLWRLC